MSTVVTFTTADKIATHLKLSAVDTLAGDCAAAVNALLAGRDDLMGPPQNDAELTFSDLAGNVTITGGQLVAPTADAMLGATMLGARLHRRRNSANGIESFDGTTASYVARTDPDVARLLRLDQYAMPGVG